MLRIGLLSTLVLAAALGGAGLAPGAAMAAGPDFSLSANPTSVSVPAGIRPASTQVTVTPSGGFTGTVTFQVSGVPDGTTATVVPNSSGASIVFNSSSSAPFSSSTVTITGTSGSLTHTVAIGLQVVPPVSDFAISANPSSVTVSAGSGAQTTIHATTQTGFSGLPTFTASGLPTGVTASFTDTTPVSGGFVSALLFTAASTAPPATATITVTGFAGSVASATTTVSLTVTGPSPDFSLSANPTSASLLQGSIGSLTISVAASGGFAGSVAFGASGLPNGVTPSFSPASSTTGTTLTLSAFDTATAGSSTFTVTGTSGSLSHTLQIPITVIAAQPTNFALSASPSSLSVQAGSSAAVTIAATPSPGVGTGPGPVSLSVSGLPAGVAATFSPNPITSLNSTMTITAAGTASAGSATVTVTGTGVNRDGPIVHTVNIALTVTAAGATGGVTVAPVVSTSGPYFNEEDLKLANTASLTSLSITIVVQRTPGLSFSGQFNTIGGSITQSSTSTASTITYQFNLAAGSTLGPGTGWTFAAQTGGTGTAHPTAGDTFSVTYTTGGVSFTQTGHF